ncbi:MAG: 4-hydroxythreonine-4-phosphate dehydrogenase PdxA [Rhodobacteraceae bacterium]|nr:4-hydroxythreonine-4-phosphate dehydrogenase PdxA [Paracoccaceae bacterium]
MKTFCITMGDPAGIGPEIIVKALMQLQEQEDTGSLRIFSIGCRDALEHAAEKLGGGKPRVIRAPEECSGLDLSILPVEENLPAPQPGQVSVEGGIFAFRAVEEAVRLALESRIDGLVTAPLNKAALNRAGYAYAGHTDMLADLTETQNTVMMLAHGSFRVTHLSTHVPLSEVPRLLTEERLDHVLTLTFEALKRLGIRHPRVAVAALNPHGGEGGLFGREDLDVSQPVIERWQHDGHDVHGPVPGDTVFVKLRGQMFDAVVAMYLDEGHVPFKLLGFETDIRTGTWESMHGVNVTLGLPIIRTSVDHGTAFDIAGDGIANADSLIEAIDYARHLAGLC